MLVVKLDCFGQHFHSATSPPCRSESLVSRTASSPGPTCCIDAQVPRCICHRTVKVVCSEDSLHSLRQALPIADDHLLVFVQSELGRLQFLTELEGYAADGPSDVVFIVGY